MTDDLLLNEGFVFKSPARFILAPSGAGKTTWARKTGLAVDGDYVIETVFGWRHVRRKFILNQFLTGDIPPSVRLEMSQALHNFSRNTGLPLVFNGALVPETNSFYAGVFPPRATAVRWRAARDNLTQKEAGRLFDLNVNAQQILLRTLKGQTAQSFDEASRWLDDKLLSALHNHTRAVARVTENES